MRQVAVPEKRDEGRQEGAAREWPGVREVMLRVQI